MVRFDWYEATVRAPVGEVQACLSDLAERGQWEMLRKAPHGYGWASQLVDVDGPVARVWWGGMHQHPHAVVSGETAQGAAQLLRTHLADHSVSRADPCIDYAEPGAYDRLQAMAVDVAKERGVKIDTRGDHLATLKGRTVYLGATSSPARLRLYDKAAELRAQYALDPVRAATVPEELARLELQVRPHTPAAKRAAALAEPVELMGSAAWMRELMKRVADLDIEPFLAGKPWRQRDDDRAYAAMLAHYGGLISRMAQVQGWECLGLQIRDDLAERVEATKRRGMAP